MARTEQQKQYDKEYNKKVSHVWIHNELKQILTSGKFGKSIVQASRNLAEIARGIKV